MKFLVKLQRIALTLLFLLIVSTSAFATEITVDSKVLTGFNYPGVNQVKMRIYLSTDIVTGGNGSEAGRYLIGGVPPSTKFYKEVNVNYSGGVWTIDGFKIDSTTDANTPTKSATYSFYLFTNAGQQISVLKLYQNIKIFPSYMTGVTTTLQEIAEDQYGIAPRPPQIEAVEMEVFNRRLAQINAFVNPLTTTGDTISSVGTTITRIPGSSSNSIKFYTETAITGAPQLPQWTSLNSSHVTTALGYTPANKAGDTITGNIIMGSGAKITLDASPTDASPDLQAASVGYVKTKAGNIASFNGSSAANQTIVNDTNITITNVGGVNTINWVGFLSFSRGGFGFNSTSVGSLYYGTSGSTIGQLPSAATGNVLHSGNAPSWAKVDLTSEVSGINPSITGGTGNGFTKFSGPAGAEKTFALPNISATILTDNAPVTVPQGGTNFPSYTRGDLLVGNAGGTLNKLATGASGTVLHGGTDPTYSQVSMTADITGITPPANGGSGVNTLTGYAKGSGTSPFTGVAVIPIADGGSNATTFNTNGVVYFDGTRLVSLTVAPTGTVLAGSGVAPAFTTSPVITQLGFSNAGLNPNSVPFINGSRILAEDNTAFTWDNTNKILKVKAASTAGGIQITNSGNGGFLVKPNAGGTTTYNLVLPSTRPGGVNYSLVGSPNGDGTSVDLAWANVSGGGGTPITINGSGDSAFVFTTGSTGTDFDKTVNSSAGTTTITFNLPTFAGGVTTRGLLSNTTQTLQGKKTHLDTLTLRAGSATDPPLQFQAPAGAALVTDPTTIPYAMEVDTSRPYYITGAGVRKSIAFLDSNITGSAASFTGSLAGAISGTQGATAYNQVVPTAFGGLGTAVSITSADAGKFIRVNDGGGGTGVFAVSTDGSGITGLSASNLGTGTVPLARISGLLDANIAAGANIAWPKLDFSSGTIVGSSLAHLADRDASYLTGSNTLPDGVLSTNVQLKTERNTGCGGCAAGTGYPTLVTGKLQALEVNEVISVTGLTEYSAVSGNVASTYAIRATISNSGAPATDKILRWNSATGTWEDADATVVAGHKLLSATHTDTTPADPVVGSVIVGSDAATPLWTAVNPPSAGKVLHTEAGTFGNKTVFAKLHLVNDVDTATQLPSAAGGTGVANTGTITLGGNLVTAGAFNTTITVTGTTNATLPIGTKTLVATDVTTLSSLTSIGTISAGVWNGTVVAGQYGGSGVANTGKTITLGGNLVTSGAFNTTITVTADSNATLPAGTKTLVATDVTTLSSLASIGTVTTGVWNGTIITSAYGGTGNGFAKFSGPATSEKTFTLPNVSTTVNTNNDFAAKGDMRTGTAAGTSAVLTVGANNTVLTADSAQTTGTKWSTVIGSINADTTYAQLISGADDISVVTSAGTTTVRRTTSNSGYESFIFPTQNFANGAQNCAVLSTNQQLAFRWYFPTRVTINRVAVNVTTLSASKHVGVAIYNTDGTRALTSGALDAASTGVKTATGLATTIGPGWYTIVFTADSTVVTVAAASGNATSMALYNAGTNGQILCGTTTNTSTAGAPNTTTGNSGFITATDISTANIPIIIFSN